MKNSVKNKLPLPENLISQLAEHTRSYILFYIDGDGNPAILSRTGEAVDSLALCRHAENYLCAVSEINNMEMLDALSPNIEEDSEEN